MKQSKFKIRFLILVNTFLLLSACGQSGPLYLPKAYQAKHAATSEQVAPSASLQDLQTNERVIHDN